MTTQDTTLASIPYAFNIDSNNVVSTLKNTALPPATATTLGAVKVGLNLSITPDGTLSAAGGAAGTIISPNNTIIIGATDQATTLDVAIAPETARIQSAIGSSIGANQPITLAAQTSPFNTNVAAISYDTVRNQLILLDQAGRLAYSTNGITFTSLNRISTTTLFSRLSFGLINTTQNYIATAQGGEVYRSLDLVSWIPQTLTSTLDLTYCIYANGTFAITQKSISSGAGGGLVYRSTDGLTWQSASVPGVGTNNLQCIAFGNGIWVVGTNGGQIFTSSDLVNWTLRVTTTQQYTSIAYGRIGATDYYIAVGPNNNSVTYSTNGTVWTTVATNGFAYSEANFLGDRFVAAGSYNPGAGVTYYAVGLTYDGAEWTHQSTTQTGTLVSSGQIPNSLFVSGAAGGALLSGVAPYFLFQDGPTQGILNTIDNNDLVSLTAANVIVRESPASANSLTLSVQQSTGFITTTNNGSIAISPNGSGSIVLGNTVTASGWGVAGGQTTYATLTANGAPVNVDGRIMPKGSGDVILGNYGAFNCLAIQGGQSTNCVVTAESSTAANVGLFLAPKGTADLYLGNTINGFFRIEGNNTAYANLRADGLSTDIDVVLTAKGSGNLYPFGRTLSSTQANQPQIYAPQSVGSTVLTAGQSGQTLFSAGTASTPYWSYPTSTTLFRKSGDQAIGAASVVSFPISSVYAYGISLVTSAGNGVFTFSVTGIFLIIFTYNYSLAPDAYGSFSGDSGNRYLQHATALKGSVSGVVNVSAINQTFQIVELVSAGSISGSGATAATISFTKL